jgi:hypothetical protein
MLRAGVGRAAQQCGTTRERSEAKIFAHQTSNNAENYRYAKDIKNNGRGEVCRNSEEGQAALD